MYNQQKYNSFRTHQLNERRKNATKVIVGDGEPTTKTTDRYGSKIDEEGIIQTLISRPCIQNYGCWKALLRQDIFLGNT
nr:hypothetical protein [Tanacetum cinerariifolium]